MSERIQLNVRLDKYPELYDLIKERASLEGLSINDFVVRLINKGMGIDTDDDDTPLGKALSRISALERRLSFLEEERLGECQVA
jgi:hypothetical protein